MTNEIIYKNVRLDEWIKNNTATTTSIVELGAGFFAKLSAVHPNVQLKIGIEIYKPYIDNATYHDCIKIHGSALNYKELLKDYVVDTVMIIDVLEHFDKNVGYELINNLKNDFKKILLMLPAGTFAQDKDVTGFGGHEYQTHKSYWYIDDIKNLSFTENIIDSTFHSSPERTSHNLDTACYFGVWTKTI
jgi:hypothetical protein